MHHKYEGHVIKAEESALICSNWELDALRRKGGDALIRDAVGRGLHWNALGVAFPRGLHDETFAKFAQTVVAHQPVDRAMLRHDAMRSERRRLAAQDAGRLDATGAALEGAPAGGVASARSLAEYEAQSAPPSAPAAAGPSA